MNHAVVKCCCAGVEISEVVEAVCQGDFGEWQFWWIINGSTGLPFVTLYDGLASYDGEARHLLANDIIHPLCGPLLRDDQHFRRLW